MSPVSTLLVDIIVQNDTVDDVDRLVILVQCRCTTNQDFRSTKHTTVRRCHLDTGNLTLQGLDGVDEIGIQFVGFKFGHCITQSFLFALDTESGHHYFVEGCCRVAQRNVHVATRHPKLLRLVADVGHLEA